LIQRPWVTFSLLSGLGLVLILMNAVSATESVLGNLPAVLFFFAGWLVLSAVVWFAAISAAHALVGKNPVVSRDKIFISVQLIAASVQGFSFLFPHAAAAFAWGPRSLIHNFLILVYVYSAPALLVIGVLLAGWAFIQTRRYLGKTSVRIRVMHMQGNWPVWFDNEVMDEEGQAPISPELKSRGLALSKLFESSTNWNEENTSFEWASKISKEQFNEASRSFAQDLASELGPDFFVLAEAQKSRGNTVQLGDEIFTAS
jgi:hypothetical protein